MASGLITAQADSQVRLLPAVGRLLQPFLSMHVLISRSLPQAQARKCTLAAFLGLVMHPMTHTILSHTGPSR